MSKLVSEELRASIKEILRFSSEEKKRGFVETVELQVGLKNYDPQRDKRFSGTVRLPYVCRPRMKIALFGDQIHIDMAKKENVTCFSVEELKKFKKNKKQIKRFAQGWDAFLASDTLVKQVPRIMGPTLNKMGRFPIPINKAEDMHAKMEDMRASAKFQLKKVLCMSIAVGNVGMTEDELAVNIQVSVNFLISLLKKQWQNVKTLHIKSTMGPVQRIY